MLRLAPCALTCSLLLASSAGAADPVSVTLDLPKSFPLNLITVVSAQLPPESGHASTFQIVDPRLGDDAIIAQREMGMNRVWMVASVRDPQLLGRQTTLRAQPQPASPAITVKPASGGLQFFDQGREVLFYQREPATSGGYTRANYVHPLRGLDGETLTEAFPDDHLHHHGVFWAWHQLWVGSQKVGDPWVTTDFLTVVRAAQIVQQGPVFSTLRVTADWTSPLVQTAQGDNQPIVAEESVIRVFRASQQARWIDFEIRLRPLLPSVKIGGAENERGYSGFTARLKPPAKMLITTASGAHAEDVVGAASSWADVSGLFDGSQNVSGVSLLCHPSLAEFPPRWLLRHYGMQNVVYPGREPVQLSAQHPLRMRHRLLIHRGDAQAARVAQQQQAYQAAP